MTVLDIVCRDPRITPVPLIEPDIYKPHNVARHLFPLSAVDGKKAELARKWLEARRPELFVNLITTVLMSAMLAKKIEPAAQPCDTGICPADNEPAKFHFDALMRRHQKPWTLGE